MEKIKTLSVKDDIANTYFFSAPCCCCGNEQRALRYPIDEKYAEHVSGISIHDASVSVALCLTCKHEYIYPVPNESFLTAFYASYMSGAKSGFYKARSVDIDIPVSFTMRYSSHLAIIKKLLSKKDAPTLLDVGCGLGMFLRLAKSEGFDVYGIEPNNEAATITSDKFNIPVENCLFENSSPSKYFDVITMWDLLEHLQNPNLALNKAKSLLTNRGLLVIEIPASDSLLHRLAKILYISSFGMIRRPLYLVCGIHHLNYFSEKNISKLLTEHGYEIAYIIRSETDIMSLYKKGDKHSSMLNRIVIKFYNISLTTLFLISRLFKNQNKLILFARKV
jgi:2-polyprenyl-3-methyl-5-hydroxy-6-metoxy-1,4-benzoquinol methylase